MVVTSVTANEHRCGDPNLGSVLAITAVCRQTRWSAQSISGLHWRQLACHNRGL